MSLWVPPQSPVARAGRGQLLAPGKKPQYRTRSPFNERAWLLRRNFGPEFRGPVGQITGGGSNGDWVIDGWNTGGGGAAGQGFQVGPMRNYIDGGPLTWVIRFRADAFISFAYLVSGKRVYNDVNGIEFSSTNSVVGFQIRTASTQNFNLPLSSEYVGNWVTAVVRWDGTDVIYADFNNGGEKESFSQGGKRVNQETSDNNLCVGVYNANGSENSNALNGTIEVFRHIDEFLPDAAVAKLLDDAYYGLEPVNQSPFYLSAEVPQVDIPVLSNIAATSVTSSSVIPQIDITFP